MRMALTSEQKAADRVLRSYDLVQSRLESSLYGLEKAESAITSITSSLDALSVGSSNNDKLLSSLICLDRAADEVYRSSEEYGEVIHEVEELITEVQRQDASAGKVLRLTYLHRLSAKEIAEREDIGVTRKTVYEYLKRGLDCAYRTVTADKEQ